DDVGEFFVIEARAAYQDTIYVAFAHDGPDVVSFDRSTIQHTSAASSFGVVEFCNLLTDRGSHFLGIGWSGDFAGSNGPHGFVSDHEIGHCFGIQLMQGTPELVEGVGHVITGLARLEPLTDTEDGGEVVP